MKTHKLKTDMAVFQAVKRGVKRFEIRKDDRDYSVGDELILQETQFTGEEMASGSPLIYTEQTYRCLVEYIMRGPVYGLEDGWIIMSIRPAQQLLAINNNFKGLEK